MSVWKNAGAAGAVMLVWLLIVSGAEAQQPDHGHVSHAPREAPNTAHYDAQYGHNRYYTPHGVQVGAVPGRPYIVSHSGAHYYYSGGVWYAPRGPYFVVVGPPVGVFVPVLPPYYTTVWFGGAPYYYANDTYYQWQAAQNGYVIVNPPAGADQPGTPPPGMASTSAPGAPVDNVYIYPKNGQSADQQAADRFECHDWARNQTGFDPTQPGGGVAAGDNGSKREQYQRAMGACLEARGYSVK
jgi:hypothetical protein